jgi:3',5'-cyclic AMP phosphodiesterase CpdA
MRIVRMRIAASLLLWSGAVVALVPSAGVLGAGPEANAPEGPFVVKPYLQLGPAPAPGTLDVLWHAADADAEWSVAVQSTAEGPWRKAEPATARRVAAAGVEPHRAYRATLTGLEPGASFHYVVSRQGRPVFSASGRAPKSAVQAQRVVLFGDCGAGTAEQKPLAYQAWLSRPDLVVIPGDIVYEYGLISDYREKFWPVYNADEASVSGVPFLRSTPFVAAPGNHDTETRDLERYPDALAYYLYLDQPLNGPIGSEGGPFVPPLKGPDASRRAFLEAAGPAYPRMTNFSFDYGNAHWTIVDSNTYVDWTDPALRDWVARDLAAARDATWRFVAFHHPGFNSAREHYEQQQMRLLAPVFEAGKVDVVFSGHVHNYQRSFPLRFVPDRQGTLLVGGRDGKTIRGRVVNGRWMLDRAFDGRVDTTPDGVIYAITGAGGQHLYNPEQNDDPDSWQKFTDRFVSRVHSFTVADIDGKSLAIRQVASDGTELDRFSITK